MSDDVPGTFRMTLQDWSPNEIKRTMSRCQRYVSYPCISERDIASKALSR